jgi:hypothetical protein
MNLYYQSPVRGYGRYNPAVNGLIFQKTVVWKWANFSFWLANVVKGLAMILGICIFTFSLYIVAGSYHLLSLTGMVLIACVIVLLAKDELSGSFNAIVWDQIRSRVLRGCIQGSFTDESGWMITDNRVESTRGLPRFLSMFKAVNHPRRVLKVVADDGESFVIGWDFRPVALSIDTSTVMVRGQSQRFVKQLFS